MNLTRRRPAAPRAALSALAVALATVAALIPFAVEARAAQGVRLPGLGGGELTDGDLARGNHVLVVWASWSPRCRDIVERVNGIHSHWGDRARVATIDFQEDPAEVERFLRGKGLAVPVYLDRDGDFSKSMAITWLPGLLVYRDGRVAYQGRLPSDPASVLDEALR
jgi:thiol-disulfide isomerase/thioredoxin